jgi:D-aminopeptidase
MSLPPVQVRGLMKEAVERALERPLPRPFIVKPPFHLELEMTTLAAAEMLAYLPNVERTSAFAVASTFDTVAAVMRFVAFAMLYSPNGVPALA